MLSLYALYKNKKIKKETMQDASQAKIVRYVIVIYISSCIIKTHGSELWSQVK